MIGQRSALEDLISRLRAPDWDRQRRQLKMAAAEMLQKQAARIAYLEHELECCENDKGKV